MNFNTANQTLRQLLGNGLTYRVPRFQRDYSWTEDEWDDLWNDIRDILKPGGEPAHYMGYLVLQSSDSRSFDIIDGQQRLTTLSIFVLAILKNLQILIDEGIDPESNKRRSEQLRNSYIGYLDPVTLVAQSKLSLNRNNDEFYQNYLVPLERIPQRGLKVSEHLLRKAFEWFTQRLKEEFGQQKNGAELAKVVDAVADKLFFTAITVTDELNAFKVFETLNARGVRLSATDLLKNYLFSVVHAEGCHETEIQNLEQRWETLVGKMGSESFPDFLRVSWNSRNEFVRQADLFKTIRGHIRDKGHVFALLRHLDEDADVYRALSEPADTLWTADQRVYVDELRMFSVRQPYPLLIAVKRAFADADFTTILRACSIISFRYNVIGGLASNEQERVYNNVAARVAKGELAGAGAVIRELRSVYRSDAQFSSAFAEKQLKTTQSRNKRVVRYILFKLERHLSGADYDFDSDLYTIEHILPESPHDNWPDVSDDQVERFAYRLGNMTLLQARENRDLGNQGYATKRPVYAASEFAITNKIAAENEVWSPDRIEARQQWMARQATGIWRIDQIS